MLVSSLLVLLWISVDYVTEFSNFWYFACLRVAYGLPTLGILAFYSSKPVQRNLTNIIFCTYCLLVTSIGLLVVSAENLLLYSMGYSTVFIGSALFLIWKPRYFLAAYPIVALIVIAHITHLNESHEINQLTIVGAYLLTILAVSVVLTYVNYQSYSKQFFLIYENEKYETELAQKLAEVAAANKALEGLNATQQKFFSIIAHDLRGPAGSLSVLFNELITSSQDLDDSTLVAVRSTTKNLYQLLEQLLSWARSQQGTIEYNPEIFNLNSSIEKCLGLLSSNATQKGIELTNLVSDQLYVNADISLTSTVIRNFVNNAIKFCSKNDRITVTACQKDSMIEISVTDTGIGISPQIIEKLFSIDQKTQSSLGTNNEAGSGLGLVLCKEFIKTNGGQIGVESELEKGSRFWITLPRALPNSSDTSHENADWLKQIEHIRVLVADDSDLHLMTSSVVLTNLNIDFKKATNGLEAVQMIHEHAFDIVLLDIDMPIMNGIMAARLISEHNNRTPWIIALSSYSEFDLNMRAEAFPFSGYLNKPLSREAFLGVINTIAHKKQGQGLAKRLSSTLGST